MSDKWISLSEAYNLLFYTEKDELLVQKLLIPALWHGEIPCRSMRIFIDNKLQDSTNVVTIRDWPLEECPIVYDWANSRAVLPRGFYRENRDTQSIQFFVTEYFCVEVSKTSLTHFFPMTANTPTGCDEFAYRTGSAGKPSAKFVIPPEIERRAAAGEKHSTLSEWGDVLEKWYIDNYAGKAPPITSKTIQNNFRGRLKDLLSGPSPGSARKPRPK